jgi:hypothetical protein
MPSVLVRRQGYLPLRDNDNLRPLSEANADRPRHTSPDLRPDAVRRRASRVSREIRRTVSYTHTADENGTPSYSPRPRLLPRRPTIPDDSQSSHVPQPLSRIDSEANSVDDDSEPHSSDDELHGDDIVEHLDVVGTPQ